MKEKLHLKKGEHISEERLHEFARDLWAVLTNEAEIINCETAGSGTLKENVEIVARTVRA